MPVAAYLPLSRGPLALLKSGRSRIVAILAIALAGTFSLAGAQTARRPAAPAIAAASVRWVCTGRCAGVSQEHSTFDPKRAECDGCSALAAIVFVYGRLGLSRLIGLPRWAIFDLYNFEIVSTDPVSREQMNHVLFRQVLDQCFAFRARMVSEAVPGYALVVAPGGIKFPEIKKPPPGGPPKEGIVHLSTLPQLARNLTGAYYEGKKFGVTRPVRDATGLRGFYSIPYPFVPEPETNLLAWIGRLGLRVIPDPDQATDTRLHILNIDHLHTNCEIGPEAPSGRN